MYNDEEKENDFEEEKNFESSTGNKFLDFYYANKRLVIIFAILVLALIILLAFSSCNKNSSKKEDVISIVISKENVNVSIDNTIQLASSVSEVPNAQIVWSSSNDDIATVNNQGLVTGIKYGTATITATYTHTDSNVYKANCTVVVADGDPNLKIIEANFPDGSVLLSTGNKYKVPFLMSPSNGFLTDIKYTSSDSSIATISEDGVLTALKSGKVVISLNVNDGEFTDTIEAFIVDNTVQSQIIIFPTSLTFKETYIKVSVNNPIKLEYNQEPTSSDSSNLIWESADNNIVTVSNDGTILGVNQGVTTVTVKTLNGLKSSILVTVEKAIVEVEGIEIIDGTSRTLTKGNMTTIIPNVLPSNASNKNVTFSSSNTSIATVDSYGNVSAVGVGSCTITVTTNDQGKKATVNITVTSSSSGGSSTTTVGSFSFTSDKKAVERTYADADTKKVEGPVLVTAVYYANVTNVKYCTYMYGNTECTPDKTIKNGNTFTISDPGITVIKYIVYNGSNNETRKRYVGINETSGGTTPPSGGTITPPTDGTTPPSGGSTTPQDVVKIKDNSTTKVVSGNFSAEYTLSVPYLFSTRLIKIHFQYNSNNNISRVLYCVSDSQNCSINSSIYEKPPVVWYLYIRGESFDSPVSGHTYGLNSYYMTETAVRCKNYLSFIAFSNDGKQSDKFQIYIDC